MRPSAPYLAWLNSPLLPPLSPPLGLLSPIDTLAHLLTPISDDAPDEQQLTPTMQYATSSPLLQHHREHQLHALQQQQQQQQQCIPGLSQIYTPMTTDTFSHSSIKALATLSESPPPSSSDGSYAAYDGPDADSDYTPITRSLCTRKRTPATSPSRAGSLYASPYLKEGSISSENTPAPPTKRQRAAPSGPVSTKDWIPPDVSGLNKREARLVKNRAAAFLSRQRKREEFELMEIRVQELEVENARLRQSASASASSPALAEQQAQHLIQLLQQLRDQLAESKAREETLAIQVRDLRSSLSLARTLPSIPISSSSESASPITPSHQQQQQSAISSAPSSATLRSHQPIISTWPSVGVLTSPTTSPTAPSKQQQYPHPQRFAQIQNQPSSFYQLSTSMPYSASSRSVNTNFDDSTPFPAPLEPVPVKTEAVDVDGAPNRPASDESDDESDDSELGPAMGNKKQDGKQLVVREKGEARPSGSVAFMVLLFSLSLLSGQGRTGSDTVTDAKKSAASTFAFNLSNQAPTTPSSFDLPRLAQQQQQPAQPEQGQGHGKDSLGESIGSGRRWATLDGLDEEFDYFERPISSISSASASSTFAPLAFDAGLDALDTGQPFEYSAYAMSNMPMIGLGTAGMNLNMGMGIGMGDTMMEYPTSLSMNSPASPFSLTSTLSGSASNSASVSTPGYGQLAYNIDLSSPASAVSVRPSTASTTFSSGTGRACSPARSTASSSATVFQHQLEVSVRRPALSSSHVTFDLKLGGSAGSEDSGDVNVSSVQEKTLTVHVRKVDASCAGVKNKIVLELTSSTSSSTSTSSIGGVEGRTDSDNMGGLEADFDALLGRGLGALAESVSLGQSALGVDMAQWRLALASRDVVA